MAGGGTGDGAAGFVRAREGHKRGKRKPKESWLVGGSWVNRLDVFGFCGFSIFGEKEPS